jgi:hypothetical protein
MKTPFLLRKNLRLLHLTQARARTPISPLPMNPSSIYIITILFVVP